jgi:hypothetical protein
MGDSQLPGFRLEHAILLMQAVSFITQLVVAARISEAEKRMEQRLSQHVVDFHRKGA